MRETTEANELRGEAFTEWLTIASMEDLESARLKLVADIQGIDFQLSAAGRMEGGEFTMSKSEYFDWRHRAIGAKQAKVRQQMAVRAELARRRQAENGPKQMSRLKFWRSRANALRGALRDVIANPDLAADIAQEALDEYDFEVEEYEQHGPPEAAND